MWIGHANIESLEIASLLQYKLTLSFYEFFLSIYNSFILQKVLR